MVFMARRVMLLQARDWLFFAALSLALWILVCWITPELDLRLVIFCAFLPLIGASIWVSSRCVSRESKFPPQVSDASVSPDKFDNGPLKAWVPPAATKDIYGYNEKVLEPLISMPSNVSQRPPTRDSTLLATTFLHEDARNTRGKALLRVPDPRQPDQLLTLNAGAAASVNARFDKSKQRTMVKEIRIFDPNHYRRHSGVPGFLYMARNPFHQVGLYKLGYTTVSPVFRVDALNKEHKKASDVGHFELMHSVPVSASYDAEQALFDVISEARVIEKREFFFETNEYLTRSLEAARSYSAGSFSALTQFYEWTLDQDPWKELRPIFPQSVAVPQIGIGTEEWIFIARNQWHRDNIFRVSHSKHNPLQLIQRLNATQRKLTTQLGFYTLVLCVTVDDMAGTWKSLTKQLANHRVAGSCVFYEAPLDVIATMIEEARRNSAALIKPIQAIGYADCQISVEKVRGRPSAAWVAWTAPCPTCEVILRFKGAIGDVAAVGCPSCQQRMDCHIGSRGVIVSKRTLEKRNL